MHPRCRVALRTREHCPLDKILSPDTRVGALRFCNARMTLGKLLTATRCSRIARGTDVSCRQRTA